MFDLYILTHTLKSLNMLKFAISIYKVQCNRNSRSHAFQGSIHVHVYLAQLS